MSLLACTSLDRQVPLSTGDRGLGRADTRTVGALQPLPTDKRPTHQSRKLGLAPYRGQHKLGNQWPVMAAVSMLRPNFLYKEGPSLRRYIDRTRATSPARTHKPSSST